MNKSTIPFIIQKYQIHEGNLQLTVQGFSSSGATYEAQFYVKNDLEIGPNIYFYGENVGRFIMSDDSLLRQLLYKYELKIKYTGFKPEVALYNLSPTGVIPQEVRKLDLEKEAYRFKSYLNNGNVEFYINIDIPNKLFDFYPRYDDEKYLTQFTQNFTS